MRGQERRLIASAARDRLVIRPHEGSGDFHLRIGRFRRRVSFVPMRGQETQALEGQNGAEAVIRPHEGSGVFPRFLLPAPLSKSFVPMRGQECYRCGERVEANAGHSSP